MKAREINPLYCRDQIPREAAKRRYWHRGRAGCAAQPQLLCQGCCHRAPAARDRGRPACPRPRLCLHPCVCPRPRLCLHPCVCPRPHVCLWTCVCLHLCVCLWTCVSLATCVPLDMCVSLHPYVCVPSHVCVSPAMRASGRVPGRTVPSWRAGLLPKGERGEGAGRTLLRAGTVRPSPWPRVGPEAALALHG